MTQARGALLLVVAALFLARAAAAQEPVVTIDRIEENKAISGRVTGLPLGEFKKYKVVVYVLTDKWYIHPFAGDAEGKSWASIRPDGTWSLATVRRDFPADRVGAFVVERGYEARPTLETITAIPSRASYVKTMKNTPDYKKL